ncbi:MAG: hypothetical protein FJ387_29325, partial [Verrucomicrobia bacterium]|nr:hypothetical protein [Verrucomicrobiota bacterium]
GSIQVNWTDNSTGEANYKIERKIGAGSFSTYATLAANSTGYNDTSVTPGTLYTYRVFAYSGIFASVYSAEASATAVSASAQGLSLSPLSLAFSSSARSVVDLQVFYTPAAKNEAGGDANLCNEIAAAVKQSNDAYVNSQVNHRLRLLNIETVDYTEATVPAGGIGTDIDRLMKKTDGHLDGVHILRDQKGADVVVLVEAAGVDQGGISKAMTNVSHSFESNALCIVRRPEMNGFFALPHEVGHIMGCAHDRGQPDTGAYSYSYGYVFQSGGNTYGDIMSYPPVGATRIPYFSNPNVLYGGVPTGISESQPTTSANTALTMNNTASTVAGFRSAVLSASVVTISNSSASQITVSSISAETPAPWLSISPQGSFSVNANSAQNVTVQVDYGLAPSGYSNVRLLVVTNGVSIPGGIAVIVDNDTPPPTRVISLSGNLAFGNVTVGTSAQSTLTIANNGNSTLTVNSISYPSGFSGNWSGTIPQGDSHNVSVTFSPISAINYGGNNLVVNSDATSGTGSRAISGVGVSRPNLSISKQGGDLVFTWPANVSGFTLEYTTNLPATSWTSNPILPVIVGQNYTVTNPITDGNKFFRLTK